MKYKMTLSYDGTNYGGWQIQPNRESIQELVQNALKTLFRTNCPITGSGRTDAGVHALHQVAHFSYEPPLLDIPSSLYSLNALLPPDIRIKELSPTSDDFHARFSVKKKIYHYNLHLSPVQDPFSYRFSTPIRGPFDQKLLEEALPLFLGTHDFSSMAGAGCGSKDPIKTLFRLDLVPQEGGIRLEFEGSGFLYKMVRNIVGTLIEIATHKRPISDIPKILSAKDRCLAGPTAPPQGLFLFKVQY